MKKIITLILISLCSNCFAQNADKKWIDINYANDTQVYHNLDIYIPNAEKASYKVIVIIYGSA